MERNAADGTARPRSGAAYAAGAAGLVAAGVAIAALGDRTSVPPRLVLLIAVGTSAVGLLVGYALGHYADLGQGRRGG